MRSVLRRLLAGELSEAEAEAELRRVQLTELGEQARLDIGREHRRGIPEVLLAAGKQPADLAQLAVRMAGERGQALASRLSADHWPPLEREAGAAGLEIVRYHAAARVVRAGFEAGRAGGRAAVLTAGTSDLDAADEARMVLEGCGVETRLEADLGVAGIHRLFDVLGDVLGWDPDVLVVAAGMDGVLPGVVSGLVAVPVIGLPVSTGYGMGGGGEAAVLTMLQSCATGLSVVNVDNGVGAGAAAALIAARVASASRPPEPTARPARSTPGSGGAARSPRRGSRAG
jgi:pyridinium-3,5-biscarboxylic acid mononucleotide synthase